MKQTRSIVTALLFFALTYSSGALVNGEAPATEDTRFDAVAAFSMTKWLVPGGGAKAQHNWFGSAVLIAPDVILTARHLLPKKVRVKMLTHEDTAEGRYMVRFRRHVDGTIGSKQEGPDSYHQVPIMRWVLAERSDLALGILAKPVEHIEPVPLLLERDEPTEKQRCVLAAWGSVSPWRGNSGPRPELRTGENTATVYHNILRVDSYKVEPRETDSGKRKAYIVDDNAVPNMHDSGGSMFLLDDQDKPVLAGIISTYTGGTFLPAVDEDNFPLAEATRGGRALMRALRERVSQ